MPRQIVLRFKAWFRMTTAYYSIVRPVIQPFRDRLLERAWNNAACAGPPPPSVKRRIIRNYAHQFHLSIFVETGTLWGDTIGGLRDEFERLVSIELSCRHFDLATRRFARVPNIHIVKGDSSAVLPMIVAELKSAALFWLDAHYVDPTTARGHLDTPIVSELSAILQDSKPHIILIDDARCFTGVADYPSFDELYDMVKRRKAEYTVTTDSDIIRIAPTC